MKRKARPLRRAIHERMLRYDERVCQRLEFPPVYRLSDTESGHKLGDLLRLCASGSVVLHYDNGLRVPRSLFHSSLAPLLLSSRPATRRMVTTPYMYGSTAEILVGDEMTSVPWGPLAERSGQARL